MPHKLPKYVKAVQSKGRTYYYFDTGKTRDGKKVYTRLPDLRDPKFSGSHAALMGHRNRGHHMDVTRIPRLIDLYERSQAWNDLSASSQRLYGIYLRRLEKLLPTAPITEITRVDMTRLFDGMGATPSAANAFLSTASALFGWAVSRGYMPSNPCDGIKKNDDGEHEPWPQHVLDAALVAEDADVRLLTRLLLYTGQRLGDALAMSWRDISGQHIRVTQQKTKKPLMVRMHRDLQYELEGRKRTGLLICTSIDGRPIKEGPARNKLQKFAAKMGAHVVPHGLRKNAVNELLAAGCSIAETAAITGQTLRMVEYYARGRDQQKLGDAAILRWENAG